MTDRESELIVRLMNGDMNAFDELIPTAPDGLREKVQFIVENSNNPFIALLMSLMPQLSTKRINYDPSPVEFQNALERLRERGEISLSENPSYEDKLRIMKRVNAEIERMNKTDDSNE